MKERLHYIDIAKGILILCLLLSHFEIVLRWNNIEIHTLPHLLLQYPQPIFICFFMQCFYCLSGYCSNFDIETRVFCNKQIKQLVTPWLFFECVRILFVVFQGGEINSILSIVNEGTFSSVWFLNALFFSKLIVFSLHRLSTSHLFILTVTFILLLTGILLNEYKIKPNVLYYQHSLIASFFVAIGFSFKNKHILFTDKIAKVALIIFTIILLGRYIHIYELPCQDANISVSLSSLPLFLITSISGSIGFVYLCSLYKKNDVFEYFGRNSLIIYGLHIFPFRLIVCSISPLFDMSNAWSTFLFFFCAFSSEILFLIMAVYFLNTKYLRFLIGK